MSDGCDKKAFRSPGAAKKHAKWARKKFDARMHAYRCERCGFWHVGH